VIAYFVLGLGLLVGLLLLIKWFTEADPRRVGRALLWTLGGLGVLVGLILLWLGRYQLAWIGLPALLALASRWHQIAAAIRAARRSRGWGGGGGAADPGRSSTVETRFLRMTLMHDSGVMTGEVLEGRFAGQRLEDLSLQDAVLLWDDVASADAQSATVLESYLDRVYGEAWRAAAAQGNWREAGGAGAGHGGSEGGRRQSRANGAMTVEEARAVLGVDADADPATIRAAYRRLMQKVHPDHGGSDYFAAKLNEARRILLET
jgi:hypothetical protein